VSGENSGVGISPSPKQLATPTGLPPEDVREVTQDINPLVADAFVLYVKTKSFRWHLSGGRFRDLHLLFDEHADAVLETIDVLAERVRRVGGTTIKNVVHVLRLRTIEDDDEDFVGSNEMVRRLMEDDRLLAAAQRRAHGVCAGTGDVATTNALEDIIDETERRTWFLFECLQDADRLGPG